MFLSGSGRCLTALIERTIPKERACACVFSVFPAVLVGFFSHVFILKSCPPPEGTRAPRVVRNPSVVRDL